MCLFGFVLDCVILLVGVREAERKRKTAGTTNMGRDNGTGEDH